MTEESNVDKTIIGYPGEKVSLQILRIKSPKIDMKIVYKDSEGQTIDRKITVNAVHAVSLRHTLIILGIEAFCYTINEPRVFKMDQIREAFDGENDCPIWDLTGWLFLVIGQGRKHKFKEAGED